MRRRLLRDGRQLSRSLKNLAEYAAVLAIEAVLSAMSWESSQEFGAALGGTARHLMRRRWAMTLGNVAAAFPEKPEEERRRIALDAWRNAGRIAAEFARSRSLTRAELERIVRIENRDLLEKVLSEGHGAIVNIGHLGNWEVGGIAFTLAGYPLGVVGRVMKNPYLDVWLRETRGRFGEAVFAHHNPFFSLAKWLKSGKMTAILIDHNLYQGGIFVPFFGRPAATSTLSALLSVKLACPILSCRVSRDGTGLVVQFDEPLRHDPRADPEREIERLTVEMTAALERFIRKRPGEWLWGHNRWKRAPLASDRVVGTPPSAVAS